MVQRRGSLELKKQLPSWLPGMIENSEEFSMIEASIFEPIGIVQKEQLVFCADKLGNLDFQRFWVNVEVAFSSLNDIQRFNAFADLALVFWHVVNDRPGKFFLQSKVEQIKTLSSAIAGIERIARSLQGAIAMSLDVSEIVLLSQSLKSDGSSIGYKRSNLGVVNLDEVDYGDSYTKYDFTTERFLITLARRLKFDRNLVKSDKRENASKSQRRWLPFLAWLEAYQINEKASCLAQLVTASGNPCDTKNAEKMLARRTPKKPKK